jgi:glycosyltransferase involved in cell wall biosynthesis
VFAIPNQEYGSSWLHFWQRIERFLIRTHHSNTAKSFAAVAIMRRNVDAALGREVFHFPGTYHILDLPPTPPDIVHAHNLHVDFFDLRALPWLSRQRPFMITMHDAWLLSGHCAHSFDCERWKVGCGHCPDLTIYPWIKRDATAYNWRRKRQIYSRSRLYIATPSRWLMKKVEQSMLAPAIVESRLIPYGIDLTVFRSRDKREARAALNLPQDKFVLALRAKSLKEKNFWMDYRAARAVVEAVTTQSQIPVMVMALGANQPDEHFGQSVIRYVPPLADHGELVQYYQAADLFVHAARADTFPLTVLEALACGTPVVATQVGGIPEQIVDGVTGFLTPSGDSKAMIDRIFYLLNNRKLCSQMGQDAANDARKRFGHEKSVDD